VPAAPLAHTFRGAWQQQGAEVDIDPFMRGHQAAWEQREDVCTQCRIRWRSLPQPA
jgi:hypothetical protein